MAGFTLASYASRKADLDTQLTSARAELDQAELLVELGEAGTDDLIRARGGVTEIEARLRGLEGAKREFQRRQAVAEDVADQQARREAFAEVERLLEVRSRAVAAMEKAIGGLGKHLQEIDGAAAQLRALATAHKGLLNGDGKDGVAGVISSLSVGVEHNIVAAAVYNQGFRDRGLPGEMARRLEAGGDFMTRLDVQEANLLRLFSNILPVEAAELEEAA